MSPQPLPSLNGVSLHLSSPGYYPLEARPELAKLAMRVVAAWSMLEFYVGNLFVHLLRSDAKGGVTIYSPFKAEAAQLAAFRATANFALSSKSRERKLLEAMMRMLESCSKRRDKIVHWVWGYAEEIPDGVLLICPKSISNHADVLKFYTQALSEGTGVATAMAADRPKPNTPEIFIYREQCFKTLISSIECLAQHFGSFRDMLGAAEDDQADWLYSRLCREPDIRLVLDNLQKQAQKS